METLVTVTSYITSIPKFSTTHHTLTAEETICNPQHLEVVLRYSGIFITSDMSTTAWGHRPSNPNTDGRVVAWQTLPVVHGQAFRKENLALRIFKEELLAEAQVPSRKKLKVTTLKRVIIAPSKCSGGSIIR